MLTCIGRFLVFKGRYEEAEDVLQRMHGDHEDPSFYLRECHQIRAQIELESEKTMGIVAILTKRSLRKRFILVLGYAFSCMYVEDYYTRHQYVNADLASRLSGIIVIQNYQVILCKWTLLKNAFVWPLTTFGPGRHQRWIY